GGALRQRQWGLAADQLHGEFDSDVSNSKRKARAFLDPRLLSWDGTRERCLCPRVELGGQSVRPTPVNSTWASHYFWRCRFGNYGHHLAFKEKVPPFNWAPPSVGHHARGARHSVLSGRGPLSQHHPRPTPVALSSPHPS